MKTVEHFTLSSKQYGLQNMSGSVVNKIVSVFQE